MALTFKTEYMSNAEKRERLNRLSSEQWMRWSYTPFCIAEGAWDYADTVVDIAAQMRLVETKKLCRTIRELKRSYDGLRRKHAMTRSGYELDNFQSIEKAAGGSLKYMYSCIGESIRSQYPDLAEDYRQLLTAVYACITVLDVLFEYTKMQEGIVCKVCGFATISSILPDELHSLKKLVPEFAGDKPVKVKGRGLFVRNMVRSICRMGLTNVKSEAFG